MRKYEKIYQNIFSKGITLKRRSLSFTKFCDNNEKLGLKNKQNLNLEKKNR